ncbi:hypothetical protein EVA_15901, partial [gut metagenome]
RTGSISEKTSEKRRKINEGKEGICNMLVTGNGSRNA